MIWTFLLLLACANDEGLPAEPSTASEQKVYRYLALGDSYTIGTAIGPDSAYPALLSDSLSEAAPQDSIYYQVIARNGWTTADLKQGIAAEQPDSNFDVVSLLIGVNNQYQRRSIAEYEREFLQLLNQAISFAGGDKNSVLVLSIPDWGVSPAGSGSRSQIAQDINQFNLAQKAICDSLNVGFLDITESSREGLNNPSLIASDGLHFSAEMHQIWMRMIYPIWYANLQGT